MGKVNSPAMSSWFVPCILGVVQDIMLHKG